MATAPKLVAQRTFYKRPLPPSCIAFTSKEGKRLFAKALAEDNLESYFLLAPQMILNSFEVDPQRKWKGGWRWYDQDMLDCCRPLTAVETDGLTLPEFACLARCNGLRATVTSPLLDSSGSAAQRAEGIAKFRDDLRAVSKGRGTMALSYSRKTLGQTGDGHFSPVGAFCEEDDMVLILDVARFKYPSYWIPVELAYDSMLPIDKATGQPRGYVVLEVAGAEPGSLNAPLSLTSVTLNKSSWASLHSSLSRLLLSTSKSTPDVSSLLLTLLSHLSALPTSPLSARPTASSALPPLLDSFSLTPLASLVPFASSPDPNSTLLHTLFILALLSPRSQLSALVPSPLLSSLQTLADQSLEHLPQLREEVDSATRQLGALGECCRSEESNGAACGCAGPPGQQDPIARVE
ncbi:hypothetical protein Rhopal_007461-T1 [Rhodotorula paludigena]|uniref:glutathione gamma-glutamylcysteinyltransferase n=1 Tax=Rhodotorula paludigena TaxID=86838 RepID=A0AAV5GP66_9BASI|nr:hypothetical protein Rhopal_007461-T1 [Rhodotorula paludigena]